LQFFSENWLPWQLPLRYREKRSRSISAPKTLSFGEKLAKICPTDPEIFVLREIIKKEIKRKRKQTKEINASKIYSAVGNLSERAKQECWHAFCHAYNKRLLID